MDPSHARKYSNAEIERKVVHTLADAYPRGIAIPVDIDHIVERHQLVDEIVPIELLEDRFNVVAALLYKQNEKVDILIDQETYDFKKGRASFSIAHELGHLVLHPHVWNRCRSIEDTLDLSRRTKEVYTFIEKSANYFAGAILMPRQYVSKHVEELYKGLIQLYGYEPELIPYKLRSMLAQQYHVNLQPVEIRLKELNLARKVSTALRSKLPLLKP